MKAKRSIRFATPSRNRQLLTLLFQRAVPFSVSREGTIRYSSHFDELVDSEILSPLRRRVFPKWQVLSFPSEWANVYHDYLRQRKLRFVPEWVDGQLVYLMPASYRPHTWALPDPSLSVDRLAGAYASV